MRRVWHGVSMEDYLAMPAVSSGVICETVSRCPAAGWFRSYLNQHRPDDPSKASDAGTIAHSIALEGHADRCAVVDPAEFPSEKNTVPGGWQTKAIKAERERLKGEGKIPVLKEHWSEIKSMADSVLRFIDSLKSSEPAVYRMFRPDGGASEVTIVWDDGGTRCRLRADRLAAAGDLFADLKFARNAHPEGFARAGLIGMRYAMAGAFYRRGLRDAYSTDATPVFIVCEQEPPHLCSIVGMDPSWTAWADAKVQHGLDIWKRCVERNSWPAYPTRVAYPELPPWELAKLEAEEIEEFVGSPVDYAVLSGKATA